MKKFLSLLSIILISSTATHAQFYIGPYVGFKPSGLKGAWKGEQNGFLGGGVQNNSQSIADVPDYFNMAAGVGFCLQ